MKTVTATLVLLTALGAPAVTLAAVTVFAEIEGTEKQGTNFVNIASPPGTPYGSGCMTYKIEPLSTLGQPPDNLARIEASDADPEVLWMRNVKITATGTCVQNAHIFFYATFEAPPNTVPNPLKKVSIERSANGSLAPVVPLSYGNWVSVTGFAQHNPVNPAPPDGTSGTWEEIIQADSYVLTVGSTGKFSNLTRTRKWDPNQTQTFTGQHVLKGDLWFTLQQPNHRLQFPNDTASGFKIRSTSETGGGTDPAEAVH